MALKELTFTGEKDKVKIAIDRLKTFEPKEGYYVANSGGKDSLVIEYLAREAGVKFDSHHNLTTIDHPETIKYLREYFPETVIEKPEMSMWRLIEKKAVPPTRIIRYCCTVLKERGGMGRFVVTGIRKAESVQRKSRGIAELVTSNKANKIVLNNDNDEARRMVENCTKKGKWVLNPIIDWTDEDVWSYIKSRNLKYNPLYDRGHCRVGCVGCPMGGVKGMERDFENNPKYYINYIKAFDRMIQEREKRKLETVWKDGQAVMDWWIYAQDTKNIKQIEGQESLF